MAKSRPDRDGSGRFRAGISGNPNGRPSVGTNNRDIEVVSNVHLADAQHMDPPPELKELLWTQARAGNSAALKTLWALHLAGQNIERPEIEDEPERRRLLDELAQRLERARGAK